MHFLGKLAQLGLDSQGQAVYTTQKFIKEAALFEKEILKLYHKQDTIAYEERGKVRYKHAYSEYHECRYERSLAERSIEEFEKKKGFSFSEDQGLLYKKFHTMVKRNIGFVNIAAPCGLR